MKNYITWKSFAIYGGGALIALAGFLLNQLHLHGQRPHASSAHQADLERIRAKIEEMDTRLRRNEIRIEGLHTAFMHYIAETEKSFSWKGQD